MCQSLLVMILKSVYPATKIAPKHLTLWAKHQELWRMFLPLEFVGCRMWPMSNSVFDMSGASTLAPFTIHRDPHYNPFFWRCQMIFSRICFPQDLIIQNILHWVSGILPHCWIRCSHHYQCRHIRCRGYLHRFTPLLWTAGFDAGRYLQQT